LGFLDSTLSDHSLKHLAKVPHLENLFISSIGIVSQANLLDMAALTRLKTLNLTSTPVQPGTVIKLQGALPDCKMTSPMVQKAIDKARKKK
jgi:hypothetical protein